LRGYALKWFRVYTLKWLKAEVHPTLETTQGKICAVVQE